MNIDERQQAFGHGCDRLPPQHPDDPEYMEAYREGQGMEDGYADAQPVLWDNPSYREGYLNAAHERYCHINLKSSWVVCEVKIKGQPVVCRYPVDRPRPWWHAPWKWMR